MINKESKQVNILFQKDFEIYRVKMPSELAARDSKSAEKIIKRLECVD